MTADTGTTFLPARLGAHELVLLHGQPGSPADWQLVIARLPAQLHAVAADRPGYGSSRLPAGGFAVNARAVLDDLDSRGIERAVLVGHSYGGGVALWAASLAPQRVAAVVLLASVGPGCVNGWDRLLAAPGAGQLCALAAWRLTPWIARARLARIARRHGRPLRPDEHVNWQVWGRPGRGQRPLWRTFLTEHAPCCASSASSSTPSPRSRRRSCCWPTPGTPWFPSVPPAGSPAPCPMPACSSSRTRVITCPGEPRMPSPTRWSRSWPRRKNQPAVRRCVDPGQAITSLEPVKTSGPPLTIGGKPAIVFVSEESCPFCAAERWSVAVALSHFGTLSDLGTTSSSATDVYPNTATLSFRTVRYQSTELTLRTTELADNAGRPLQPQTALDTRLIDAFDVPPYVNSADQSGAVPFLDIANKYVLAGAQYNPQVLAGLSAAQIASQLSNPSSPVARAIDGSAQVIVAAIDQVLHDKRLCSQRRAYPLAEAPAGR